jgi:hypothetical protein
MTATQIRYHRDQEARVLTAAADDGRTSSAAIRTSLLADGARFAVPLHAVDAALDRFALQSQPLPGRLLPTALADELRKLAREIVAKPVQEAVTAVQEGKRDRAARRMRISEPPAQLPFADDDRADFRSRDIGGQAEYIMKADRSQLAALLVAGHARFADVPDPLWDEVFERHAVLAMIERTGLQADHQLKPTPNDPAAIGPDPVAAEKAARDALTRFHDDQRVIDEAEAVLRSVIIVIAVATDLSIDDAFALLTGDAT